MNLLTDNSSRQKNNLTQKKQTKNHLNLNINKIKYLDNSIPILDLVGNASKILVVGDVVIDHFINVKSKRLSSESPIPVFTHQNDDYRLGGSGNVATNLRSYGLTVDVFTVVGNNNIVKNLLQKNGIGCQHP